MDTCSEVGSASLCAGPLLASAAERYARLRWAEEAELLSEHGSLHPQRPSGRSPHRPLTFFGRRLIDAAVRKQQPKQQPKHAELLLGRQSNLRLGGHTGRAACVTELDHPRERRTNHPGQKSPRTKKGAGASPLFLRTDPPKPKTQSRLGSGHPGKPIL